MTNRQFAYLDCKQYINAGYRWCYSHLGRTGIVVPGELFDVEKVLTAEEYWTISPAVQARSAWLESVPPKVKVAVQNSPFLRASTDWLEKLLPQVHTFLTQHRKHRLRFGEAANDHFYSGTDFLEWDDVEAGEPSDISIQSLYSKGCRKWADVEAYMQSRQFPVWWWGQPELMEEAQRRFVAHAGSSEPRQQQVH